MNSHEIFGTWDKLVFKWETGCVEIHSMRQFDSTWISLDLSLKENRMKPSGQNWNYRAVRAANIASFLFHGWALLWQRRVLRAADNASLAVTAAAFLAARCRCCARNYLLCRPCWIYLTWQAVSGRYNAAQCFVLFPHMRASRFSFRRGKNSPGQPVCADVATSTATALSRTPLHAQTPAQKCPGRTSSPRHNFPFPFAHCQRPGLPCATAMAIDQSAWLPLLVAPLPWQLFALAWVRVRALQGNSQAPASLHHFHFQSKTFLFRLIATACPDESKVTFLQCC